VSDAYKCAACGGEFTKGWSEEEAIAELEELWPDFAPADCDLICDDCFNGSPLLQALIENGGA
jgi:hypothetical protein